MHPSKIVFLINDHVRAVHARYEPTGKLETFKTLDPTIDKDDLVVVESDTRWDMTVVKVEAVDVEVDLDSGAGIKWITQRIDTHAFGETLALEAKAIEAVQAAERKRKKAELRKSLFADHEDSIATLKLANLDGGTMPGVTE